MAAHVFLANYDLAEMGDARVDVKGEGMFDSTLAYGATRMDVDMRYDPSTLLSLPYQIDSSDIGYIWYASPDIE